MEAKVQTIERMIAILDCFSLDEPLLGVREIARKTGLSSSTTGRLMASMRNYGILNQDMESQTYMIGARVLGWAGIYTATSDIRTLALPVMVHLQEETRETISLYTMEGNDRICIERLESPETVRIVARVGRRIPLYAGSAGKVFLAFLSEDRTNEILAKTDLAPMTPFTITNLDDLRLNLMEIREKGYAVSKGEWISEASGVAAPIFEQSSMITAALTISGPTQRFTNEKIEEVASLVTDGAARISRDLGYISERQVLFYRRETNVAS